MNLDELEAHQSELKAKFFNTRSNTRRLILRHAADNNTEKVLQLFKEFQENEHAMSGGLISSVLGQYIQEENLEGEMILKDYFESENKNIPAKRAILRNILNLLTATADHNYEICKTLGILIKGKLTQRDYNGAVEEFERIYKDYNQVPLRIELLTSLINNSYHMEESEDKEQQKLAYSFIERVIHCSTLRYSRSDSVHQLLFAAVEAQKSDMAQKIVNKLGYQLDVKSLKRQCNYYVKQYRTEPLQTLLAVESKTYPSMISYEALLDIYYKQSDAEKALGLWTDMQEREAIPSDSFLRTLSILLIANNKKVPFQVPR